MRRFHVSFVPQDIIVLSYQDLHATFLCIFICWLLNIEQWTQKEKYIWRETFFIQVLGDTRLLSSLWKQQQHFTAPSERGNVFSKLYHLFINFFVSTLMLMNLYLLVSCLMLHDLSIKGLCFVNLIIFYVIFNFLLYYRYLWTTSPLSSAVILGMT